MTLFQGLFFLVLGIGILLIVYQSLSGGLLPFGPNGFKGRLEFRRDGHAHAVVPDPNDDRVWEAEPGRHRDWRDEAFGRRQMHAANSIRATELGPGGKA